MGNDDFFLVSFYFKGRIEVRRSFWVAHLLIKIIKYSILCLKWEYKYILFNKFFIDNFIEALNKESNYDLIIWKSWITFKLKSTCQKGLYFFDLLALCSSCELLYIFPSSYSLIWPWSSYDTMIHQESSFPAYNS